MDTVNTVDSLGFFIIHLFSHLLVGREAEIKKKKQGRKNIKFTVNVYVN